MEKLCFMSSFLMRACKLQNDSVINRLPIRKGVLKLMIDQVNEMYSGKSALSQQPYLNTLFKAVYAAAYYGLMQIGEVAKSPHTILAWDTHIGVNKKKILFILWSSKTHGPGDKPQKIKISSTPLKGTTERDDNYYCPFRLLTDYIKIRPMSISGEDQFFVFGDRAPLTPTQLYKNFRAVIRRLGFNQANYSFHSLRAGRTEDLRSLGL